MGLILPPFIITQHPLRQPIAGAGDHPFNTGDLHDVGAEAENSH